MENHYYVYILTNYAKTVLYIGITNSIQRRLYEHKNDVHEGFSKKYQCHFLLYCEECSDVNSAIAREKQLKKWSRAKKESLINQVNPSWEELKIF
ncbi:MAG: GIY-YIG nuclease family protein [Fusobacteria bacterium]|nr:GIY-YIG nuclease family protein [Fusobacteriota bacterium]